MRSTALAALFLLVASTGLLAQAPSPPTPLAFEVASVKLHPNQLRGGRRSLSDFALAVVRLLPGGRIESRGSTLRNLIVWAYGINSLYQRIEGDDDLLLTELVVEARASTPTPTSADARAMLRTLLEERFQLRWRLQPRLIDGCQLVPARDDGRPAAGLRAFRDTCEARVGNATVPFESPDYEQKARCGWSSGINGRQRAIGISLPGIAERLTMLMAAPVSDRTAWPGLFTFDIVGDTHEMPYIEVMRQAGMGAPAARDLPQLLDAMRRELGLKLDKQRVSVDDFIIERIEPLIEN
jgi:uncharacterized protein (TIGR03435 family)